jgi:hypothetical protein
MLKYVRQINLFKGSFIMEFKRLIKYFFLCGSAYFTALCGALLTGLALITGENANIGIEPYKFLLLLAFCFVLSLGSTVRRASGISHLVGWICNATCYLGGCLAFLLLSDFKFGTAALITVVFACIYAPIAIFISLGEKKKRGGSVLGGKKTVKNAPKAKTGTKAKTDKNDTSSAKRDDTPYQNLFS